MQEEEEQERCEVEVDSDEETGVYGSSRRLRAVLYRVFSEGTKTETGDERDTDAREGRGEVAGATTRDFRFTCDVSAAIPQETAG